MGWRGTCVRGLLPCSREGLLIPLLDFIPVPLVHFLAAAAKQFGELGDLRLRPLRAHPVLLVQPEQLLVVEPSQHSLFLCNGGRRSGHPFACCVLGLSGHGERASWGCLELFTF